MDITDGVFLNSWLGENNEILKDKEKFKILIIDSLLFFKESERVRVQGNIFNNSLDKANKHLKKALKCIDGSKKGIHTVEGADILEGIKNIADNISSCTVSLLSVKKLHKVDSRIAKMKASALKSKDDSLEEIRRLNAEFNKNIENNNVENRDENIKNVIAYAIEKNNMITRLGQLSVTGYTQKSSNYGAFILNAREIYKKHCLSNSNVKIKGKGSFFDLIRCCVDASGFSMFNTGLKRYITDLENIDLHWI